METTEILKNYFQSVLGGQYEIYSNVAFNDTFLRPKDTPYGTMLDINYDAFDRHSDSIVGVVQTVFSDLTNTPYELNTATYTLDLWVPLDADIKNAAGQYLKKKFSFKEDAEKLKSEAAGQLIEIEEGEKQLKMFLSMSEPYPLNGQIEKTGAYSRIVMRISGQVSLSAQDVGMGNDVKIEFLFRQSETEANYTAYEITNFTNFSVGSSDSGAVRQISSETTDEQRSASSGQTVAFMIDDYGAADNKAVTLIRKKAWQNITELSETEPLSGRRKMVRVRLSHELSGLTQTFWALMSVQYNVSGQAGFGKYTVNLVNCYYSDYEETNET
jgi:hypothetical protein